MRPQPITIDVMVVCEESQEIAKAFDALGYVVRSVDLQPCSGGRPDLHLQMDCFEALRLYRPKLLIGNPPCTFTSSAGLHWCNVLKHGQKALDRIIKREKAVKFFLKLWNKKNIPMICLENPSGYISSTILKPSQRIDPYFFGDEHLKRTMLWLKGLPKLVHIKTDDLFATHTHTQRPKPIKTDSTTGKKRYFTDAVNRTSLQRSKTFPGIAKAMAEQWGPLIDKIKTT